MEKQSINATVNAVSENVPVVTLPVTLTADVLGTKLSGLEYGSNSNGIITADDTIQSGINKILNKVHYENMRIVIQGASICFVTVTGAKGRAIVLRANDASPICLHVNKNDSVTSIESLTNFDDQILFEAIQLQKEGWERIGEVAYVPISKV